MCGNTSIQVLPGLGHKVDPYQTLSATAHIRIPCGPGQANAGRGCIGVKPRTSLFILTPNLLAPAVFNLMKIGGIKDSAIYNLKWMKNLHLLNL